jgi:hypothetical protein
VDDEYQHGPITITSNAGFTSCACVTSGTGTAANPYVIGPWQITNESSGGYDVNIDNTAGTITSSFTITGISTGYNDASTTNPVIRIVRVTIPTVVSNVSANGDGVGLDLESSSNITLDNLSFNKMNGTGLLFNNDSYVTVTNGKFKATGDHITPHQGDGLYAVNSSHLQIGGVAACPNSTPCNSFDYDSGWSVYLQNTHDVNIEHATATATDTGGYILDGANTYNVDLGNSGAQSTGPICITQNGQKFATGYVSDIQGGILLVNGAHNNTIHDDITGPNTGFSIGSGGNGVYFDPCANQNVPFSPVEGAMGANNTFTNDCWQTTDIANLPPSSCKS